MSARHVLSGLRRKAKLAQSAALQSPGSTPSTFKVLRCGVPGCQGAGLLRAVVLGRMRRSDPEALEPPPGPPGGLGAREDEEDPPVLTALEG